MRWLRVAYKLFSICLLLVIGGITVFFLSIFIKTGLMAPRHKMFITCYWYRAFLACSHIRLNQHGQLRQSGQLIVANHQSWLDIVVLGAITPTYFLSKAEVQEWPIIGWLASKVGTLYIRRGANEQAQVKLQMQHYLQQQYNILFFPEGGTGDGSVVGMFQPRLFASAIDSKQLILPIGVAYFTDNIHQGLPQQQGTFSFLQDVLLILGLKSITVQLYVGKPIDAAHKTRKQIAAEAQLQIAGHLGVPIHNKPLPRPHTKLPTVA